MPTYDYRCTQCQHALEVSQKISEPSLKLCPQCGHETLRRGPGGGIGISFGPGFYNTGYSAPPVESPQANANPAKASGCCPCGKNQSPCKG